MTIRDAEMRLLFQLYHLYDEQEAKNIADLVMENLTGWTRIDRVLNKSVRFSEAMQNRLDEYLSAFNTHKPVQYILKEAWFYHTKFYVDESVLIPRPETEELVDWIMRFNDKKENKKILDVGTGSGCIAISLVKNWPSAIVYACDISEAALGVATKNARRLQAEVIFFLADILDENAWDVLPSCDIIVSNPPYIAKDEEKSMSKIVTGHEPALALFVPDDDPLIFYRRIAEFGKKKLNIDGNIFVEMHESRAAEVKELFLSYGYAGVEIRKDMQGKERMARVY